MWNLIAILFLVLGVVTVWFITAWWAEAQKARAAGRPDEQPQHVFHSLVALVMCFFDTLGIGNFATTTSMFKLNGKIVGGLSRMFKGIQPAQTFEPGNSVRDEWIPGTLNVGYALPTVAQAYIYITLVDVNPWTLVLMIAASVAGAWLGAGVVSRWPRRKIQIGMGFALLGAFGLMLITQLQEQFQIRVVPTGEALALVGPRLWIGLAGNFALGALMTLGIGLYAPCLILVSLLGMDPRAAFPIMMGSCAFLMPIGGMRFVRRGSYSLNTTLAMSIAGIPAVLYAAYMVRSLTLTQVRWLVVVVVLYAAVMMLRSAFAARPGNSRATEPEGEAEA